MSWELRGDFVNNIRNPGDGFVINASVELLWEVSLSQSNIDVKQIVLDLGENVG